MNLKSDIEIAQSTKELPITEIAKKIGLKPEEIELYGSDKAKISWSGIKRIKKNNKLGKLILVTSISPTPAGEGKSTITIGLGDAISNQLNCIKRTLNGTCFWVKGWSYWWWLCANYPHGRY